LIPTPIATHFAKLYIDFLTDMKAAGARTDSIALVHDNTEYGASVANTITTAFKEKGIDVALDMAYAANATDGSGMITHSTRSTFTTLPPAKPLAGSERGT